MIYRDIAGEEVKLGLSLCERRLGQDWRERFGPPLWLLETFVDPRYLHGTIYRTANWEYFGDIRGFRRTLAGYGTTAWTPRRVFRAPLDSLRPGPLVPVIQTKEIGMFIPLLQRNRAGSDRP